MKLSGRTLEIVDRMYRTRGAKTGFLFGLAPDDRPIVETIVFTTLELVNTLRSNEERGEKMTKSEIAALIQEWLETPYLDAETYLKAEGLRKAIYDALDTTNYPAWQELLLGGTLLGKAVEAWIEDLHLPDQVPGRLRTWAREIHSDSDLSGLDPEFHDISNLLVRIASALEQLGARVESKERLPPPREGELMNGPSTGCLLSWLCICLVASLMVAGVLLAMRRIR